MRCVRHEPKVCPTAVIPHIISWLHTCTVPAKGPWEERRNQRGKEVASESDHILTPTRGAESFFDIDARVPSKCIPCQTKTDPSPKNLEQVPLQSCPCHHLALEIKSRLDIVAAEAFRQYHLHSLEEEEGDVRLGALAEVVVRAVEDVDDVKEEEELVQTADLLHHTEAGLVEACRVMDILHSYYCRLLAHNSTEERILPGRGCIAWCLARPKVHRWTL
jgi:hypothetical protein